MNEELVKRPLSPVDMVLAEISTAMLEWSDEQRTVINHNVKARLNKHRDHVLMSLMGFEQDSWDSKWKVDHCNGRSGNSPIGEYLASAQKTAIEEWLDKIEMPKMTDAFKKSIEKDLQYHYEQCVKSKIYAYAQSKANKDMETILDSELAPSLLKGFMKIRSIVNPKNLT